MYIYIYIYIYIYMGSRNKSENYRPVSLTSVICKLLERLIKDHMVEFLVKHKLLNSSQHGFLKARSCLTNMLCFLEEITKWIDVGSPVDIIYLDFQKAFDKVPHQRLLLKLKAHGIGDSVTDWIEQADWQKTTMEKFQIGNQFWVGYLKDQYCLNLYQWLGRQHNK